MSYQVRDTCYSSLVSALDAYAAATTGQIVAGNGSTAYRFDVSRLNATQLQFKQFNAGTNVLVNSTTVTYTPPNCGKIDVADAITLSWSVAAVWIAAFAFIVWKRSL